MADFRINIIADPKRASRGIKTVGRELNKVEQQSDRLRNNIANTFRFAAVALAARQVLTLADAFTNLQNRLRQVTNGVDQLHASTRELFEISRRTRSSFQNTGELFVRTALATRELGISQKQTLEFTESLNQAIILSGASTKEAGAGLIQLSQGLASGVLRGDELRSVLEQLPAVADVIAKSLGVTRGELRQLGADGEITSERIINAFKEAKEELEERFATTIPTVGQAFEVLKTSFIEAISEFDKATGTTETLSRAIIDLSKNMDTIGKVIGAVTATLITVFIARGISAAIVGVRALGLAIAANPIGAILLGVTAAVAGLTAFSDKITISSNKLTTLEDLGKGTFQVLKERVSDFAEVAKEKLEEFAKTYEDELDFLKGLVTSVFGDIEFSIEGFIKFAAKTADLFIGIWKAAFNVIKILYETLPSVLGEISINAINAIIEVIEPGLNKVIRSVNKILDFAGIATIPEVELNKLKNNYEGAGKDLGERYKEAISNAFKGTPIADLVDEILIETAEITEKRLKAEEEAARRRKEADDALNDPGTPGAKGVRTELRKVIDLLEQEGVALTKTSEEREVYLRLLKIDSRLKQKLSEDERNQLVEILKKNQALKDQVEILDSLRGPQNELIRNANALQELFTLGKISIDEYTEALRQLQAQQIELNLLNEEGTFADAIVLAMERATEASRNFLEQTSQSFQEFFTDVIQGFADTAAASILAGESFKDAFGNVARQALQSLLSGLIKLGLQYIINAALGNSVAAASTAASAALASATAAAWATPAALASLASFGANAAPAAAGITSTVALSNALAAIPGYQDGGFFEGAGGPRDDANIVRISDGEFIVNAAATRSNRAELEQINSGRNISSSQSTSNTNNSPISSDSQDTRQQNAPPTVVIVEDVAAVSEAIFSDDNSEAVITFANRNRTAMRQALGVA